MGSDGAIWKALGAFWSRSEGKMKRTWKSLIQTLENLEFGSRGAVIGVLLGRFGRPPGLSCGHIGTF
eukprot:597111-Pyramimonas_sp.AAC.1